MKKIYLLMFSSAVFLVFATGVSAQHRAKPPVNNTDWVGRYEYTYTEPANAGGSVPVIEYVLIVSKKNDSLIARLTADGYQANDDYQYTAKATGNQLNFYFSKVLNLMGGESRRDRRLVKGKLSGTLVISTLRGRTKYVLKSETLFGSKFAPVFKKKS